MSAKRLSLALVAALALGCAQQTKTAREGGRAVDAFFMGYEVEAQEKLATLAAKPDENYVLNNLRLGSVALMRYDVDEAERAFLRAYEVMNAAKVNDPGRSLGAVVFNENLKIWKGEPYERALANFYLGSIYYHRGDYDNARAAFENALFKLRDYGDKQQVKQGEYAEIENRFGAAQLMLGRAWTRLGREDLAQRAFDAATAGRPDLAPVAEALADERVNVMLLVEFGFAPRKEGAGMDGASIAFYPDPRTAGRVPAPRVRVDGRAVDAGGARAAPFDTVWMAHDRRWQSIDTLRAVKSGVGTALVVGGAATGLYGLHKGDEGTALVGAGLLALGLLAKSASAADVRQWELAPRTAFIVPLTLPPGTHDVTVDFPAIGDLSLTWRDLPAPAAGEDKLYFFRVLRLRQGPFTWPPPGYDATGTGVGLAATDAAR